MKFFRTTLLTVSLLVLLGLPALAQTKIATVDMGKIFSGYYKTKLSENLYEKDQADARKEIKDMADDFDKAQTDYKQLVEQANDQAISPEERDRRKQAASDALKDLGNRKAAMDSFSRQAESRLSDKRQRLTGNIVADIRKAVADKAKAGGYSLVVNSAATDTVVYAGDADDLSDAVLKQLNMGAPIDLTAPATAPSLVGTNSVP
jgi:outer membrane protein